MATKKTPKPARGNASQNPSELLDLGIRVKIRNSAGMLGRIVERRGPLGPGGAQIYRVRVRRKPKPVYIELRADQLVPVALAK